jgi:hypothetical protein
MSWGTLAVLGGVVVLWALARHFGLVGMGES